MAPPASPVMFLSGFQAVTDGKTPFRWQERLYRGYFAEGKVPAACTLSTGLGKTAVMPIWLIALANGAPLPRRLVYIVNRRTVVDQATDDAAHILRVLERPSQAGDHEAAACRLRDALAAVSGDNKAVPLAVSTLRGELADNGEWKKNPARPAIVIGTIDMIGSKLLFSGYGDWRYGRAHHAGLTGQDALIVHDEAHLSPAFDALLQAIEQEQSRTESEARRLRVMRLSATARAGNNDATNGGSVFHIENEDHRDSIVMQRLSARKSLGIVESDKNELVANIVKNALELGATPCRVLVYVRTPKHAGDIATEIAGSLGRGGDSRVALLTGTIRGFERDALARGPVLSAFRADAQRRTVTESIFLVSTSAGEVGADFDADHLVCDLTTLDSMAQRLGRVNRLGGDGRSASIVVVLDKSADSEKGKKPKAGELDAAIAKAGEILRQIERSGGDVSPAALGKAIQSLSDQHRKAAFSPEPTILPATDILFDRWSLTSIAGEMPGRPPVEDYLHGMAAWEPPETYVAWRADIGLLARAGGVGDDGEHMPCAAADLEEIFEAFPLRSAEQLRDRTERVQEQLRQIAVRLGKTRDGTLPESQGANAAAQHDAGDTEKTEVAAEAVAPASLRPNPWLVLLRGASIEWARLEEIAPVNTDDARRARRRIAFATIVLPVEVGGLNKAGMLDGREPPPADARALDVGEAATDGKPSRQRVLVREGSTAGTSLMGGVPILGAARVSVTLNSSGDDDSTPRVIEYRVAKGEEREPGERVSLRAHNDAVGLAAERFGKALALDGPLVEALRLAGRWHDAGKARSIWQGYANNAVSDEPIAKSVRYAHWKMLGGYRHEFGSLLDAAANPEIANHPERDAILHLIAAHHGWARPSFETRHFDRGDPGSPRTADNERAAIETMQRFSRLQQRFGRWGLAWLESIIRCADAEASEAPTTSRARMGGSDR